MEKCTRGHHLLTQWMNNTYPKLILCESWISWIFHPNNRILVENVPTAY